MKRLSFICATAILLASASVQAQKTSTPSLIPPPIFQYIVIEDDDSGDFLIIESGSGEYKFRRCSDGLEMSGFGIVRMDGCAVSFEDSQLDHRVLASVDLCTEQGKAVVERFALASDKFASSAFKSVLSDSSFGDNTISCSTNK